MPTIWTTCCRHLAERVERWAGSQRHKRHGYHGEQHAEYHDRTSATIKVNIRLFTPHTISAGLVQLRATADRTFLFPR